MAELSLDINAGRFEAVAGIANPLAINSDTVRRIIYDICGFGNRFVGTEGEARARGFVERSFKDAGLDNVRCEAVDILNYFPRSAKCNAVGSDAVFRCVGLQYTSSGTAEGVAVYLGRPSSLEELQDMENWLPSLEGKVVVLHTYWPWMFADHLVARNVAAIVAISETPGGTMSHITAQLYPVNPAPDYEGRPLSIPGVTMDRNDGALLVAMIANGETKLRVVHEAEYHSVRTANVVGEIRGELAENIVLGAHYDTQFEGVGAQDNATGLAALIAIAREAARCDLRRTVTFVAFCAEEQGMWGATEYCRQHLNELDSTAAMINMDALAWAIPGSRALLADPSMISYAQACAEQAGWPIEVTTNASLLRAADLNPFIDAGVPACWFWMFPPQHPFYHSTGDTIGLLDMEAVTEVANVAAFTAYRLATDPFLKLGRATGLEEAVPADSASGPLTLKDLDRHLEQLRLDLSVIRVTVRLDVEGKNFPALGEAAAPGTVFIRSDESLDQRNAATAQWVIRNRALLVQPDLSTSEVRAPGPLVDAYGVQAQMLAPVLSRGEVVGWVSVHSAEPRCWSRRDEQLASTAADRIASCLDRLAEDTFAALGWKVLF